MHWTFLQKIVVSQNLKQHHKSQDSDSDSRTGGNLNYPHVSICIQCYYNVVILKSYTVVVVLILKTAPVTLL